MSEGHYVKDLIKDQASAVVGASATAQVISEEFRISGVASLYFRCLLVASGVTSSTGITVKLQHTADGINFFDVGNRAQVIVTTNGNQEIRLVVTDASDAAQLPLYPYGRLVCTTGSGDAVTFTNAYVVCR